MQVVRRKTPVRKFFVVAVILFLPQSAVKHWSKYLEKT